MDSKTYLSLRKSNPREALQNFLKLTHQQQAQLLSLLPPQKRWDTLIEIPDFEKTLHLLPEGDFYEMVASFAREEAGPLLAAANKEQFQFLLDLTAWDKDKFTGGKLREWLEIIQLETEKDFPQQLNKIDDEELILMLHRYAKIYKKGDGDWEDISNQMDLITPDQNYGLVFRDTLEEIEQLTGHDALEPEEMSPDDFLIAGKAWFGNLLNDLFSSDHTRYLFILDSVYAGLTSNIEESAYQFHQARLEEQGLYPYHEAVQILSPLTKDTISARAIPLKINTLSDSNPDLSEPYLPAMYRPFGKNVIMESIGNIRDLSAQQALLQELYACLNKVIVAKQTDFSDLDLVKSTVQEAFTTLEKGINTFTGEATAQIIPTLASYTFGDLYRLGVSVKTS